MRRNVVTQWDSFSAKKLLQSGTKDVIKWDSFFVTKWDKSCYKLGQVFQSGMDVVTKWDGCCYEEGHLLESGLQQLCHCVRNFCSEQPLNTLHAYFCPSIGTGMMR